MSLSQHIPTAYRHAQAFYKALEEQSTQEDSLTVYRGTLTDTYRSLNISMSYYTQIRQILENMHCIEKVIQGTRAVDTVIVLHSPPTDESIVAHLAAKTNDNGDTPEPRIPEWAKILTQRVDNLEKILGGINLADALINIEQRLKTLEKSPTRKAPNGSKS